MVVHRAAFNKNAAAIKKAVESGEDVNEVEGAGNTPLHCAAYAGWEEGCELLLSLGAKVNASNNAGDRPWHWAQNMGQKGVMSLLEKAGASQRARQGARAGPCAQGQGLLPEGVLGAPPQAARRLHGVEAQAGQGARKAERNKLIPGM